MANGFQIVSFHAESRIYTIFGYVPGYELDSEGADFDATIRGLRLDFDAPVQKLSKHQKEDEAIMRDYFESIVDRHISRNGIAELIRVLKRGLS